MKAVVVVVVLIAVAILGMGFYEGWFQVGSDNAKGKSNVTLSVDKDKIKEDTKTAVAKIEDMGHQVKDKVEGSTDKNKVEGKSEQSMDGTVVRVSADKLIMTGKEGKEHSHALAADVKVTCDGKTCAVADLKAGMRIRVTADATERQTATRIEALDNNPDFKKGV
jgi:hypothetical protein